MTGPTILFTSIAADNGPARRLLERGVRGLPAYTFVGDYQTKLLRRGREVAENHAAGDGGPSYRFWWKS